MRKHELNFKTHAKSNRSKHRMLHPLRIQANPRQTTTLLISDHSDPTNFNRSTAILAQLNSNNTDQVQKASNVKQQSTQT